MSTLNRKREAEMAARAMLADNDLPQPDSIEYGEACIRLFWHEPKVCMVVDLDGQPAGAPGRDLDPDPRDDF